METNFQNHDIKLYNQIEESLWKSCIFIYYSSNPCGKIVQEIYGIKMVAVNPFCGIGWWFYWYANY